MGADRSAGTDTSAGNGPLVVLGEKSGGQLVSRAAGRVADQAARSSASGMRNSPCTSRTASSPRLLVRPIRACGKSRAVHRSVKRASWSAGTATMTRAVDSLNSAMNGSRHVGRLIAAPTPCRKHDSTSVEALAAAYAGPAHQARESAEAGLTQATEQGVVPAQLRLRWVLGLANLLDADPRGAWAVLEPALTTMVEKGVGEPGFVPAVPDAVTALAALGDLPRAKQVAAMLDRSAAAGHRWAAPAQAYCKGLVLLAAGAPDAGATELIEARDSFESIGFKFDAARSTLEAGGALRRSGQRGAAHAMVSDAVRRFAAMGASAWAERAESELARAGGRRTGQTLTAGEEQVAALAAAGRTNREIAAQLFVSVATVEANLTRAYRKLGVSSRSQLTRLRTMAAE